MSDWREKHFGVPEGPKKLRPAEVEERGGGRFWLFLFLLIAAPVAFVGGAYWLGYMDPVVRTVTEVVREPAEPTKSAPQTRPATVAPPPPRAAAPEAPPPRTITQARANELNRMITSRESGIDLMTRDRAKAIAKQQAAQRDLDAAKERLTLLEKNRPTGNNSGTIYQWNIAHSDAVAAAKNASNLIASQGKVIESFNGRIEKAQAEYDAAKDELDGAVIVP